MTAAPPLLSASLSSDTVGPPSFAFDIVPTRAVKQLLLADPLPRLVTAVAPPGYGKTVLFSRLHREFSGRGLRCLWLTLDERDSDVSSIVYRLRNALEQAGTSAPAGSSLSRANFEDTAAAGDSMVMWLVSLPGTTVVFIDNLGFCRDPALAPFLERLTFSHAGGLHLLLSSTREIPLDVVRAKLEVGAIEFGIRQLSFDRQSIARVFEQAGIVGLKDLELDRIVAQTEGWGAAVRLLQVLLANESAPESGLTDVREVLSRFGGDQRDMARVLTQRVLVGFDPALSRFMVELSLLREFNAELAEQMTGQVQAREWLETLVRRNVLIFPLDSSRRWFRFHTLMREFLLAEASDRMKASQRRDLLVRASLWHRDRGDLPAAIDLALEAGANDMAVELLDRIAHVTVGNRGQMGTLIRWVDRLVQAGVQPSPQAHAWYVWALCDTLQYERGRQALDDFDHRVVQDASLAGGPAYARLRFLRMLTNVFLDRLESNHEQATQWIAEGQPGDALTQAGVASFAAITEIDRGDLTAARTHMESARTIIERSDSAYGLAWVCILQGIVDIGMARPDRADDVLREGRARVTSVIGQDASIIISLDLVHARALLDLGHEAQACALAAKALPRAIHHGILCTLEEGLAASVGFWDESDQHSVWGAQLQRAAQGQPRRGPLLLGASRVRHMLRRGHAGPANDLAQQMGLARRPTATDPPAMRERGDWLLAGLELSVARRSCQSAVERADELLKQARHQGRERDRIEILLVTADAYEQLGQRRMASRQFAMAVTLAAPGRLVQPFRMKASLVATLLQGTETNQFAFVRQAEQKFFERLRSLFTVTALPSALESAAVAPGGLTLRQREMLVLLDEGLGTEQVADRLGLSVSTVKWHLHNAYVALGVRGRTAALARARALKLLVA